MTIERVSITWFVSLNRTILRNKLHHYIQKCLCVWWCGM